MEAAAGAAAGRGGVLRDRERVARKVQVVYYLCRNGQLEQPHFVEVARRHNQQLRLKDVTERLTALRGRGMPSLFSWSCKRRYKNGYVWNDLAGDDVVHPADGDDEYVLKGSEIVGAGSVGFSEEFHRLQLPSQRTRFPVAPPAEEEGEEENGETEEVIAPHTELTLEGDASPPSSSSSEKPHPPASAAAEESYRQPRSSILLQLIACGSTVGKFRGGLLRGTAAPPSSVSSTPNTSGRRSLGNLRKEINCMSENPRFGNPQMEEKEYFSGSIVDSIAGDRTVAAAIGPCLKKSSSYNEDRVTKFGLSSENREDAEAEEAAKKQSRCAPGGRRFPFCAGGKQ